MQICLQSLKETYDELYLDYKFCKKLDVNSYSDGFVKRSVVRAFFALVEGTLFQLKQVTVQGNSVNNILKAHEINLLLEQTYFITDKGVVKNKSAQISLLPNLLFTANSLIKVFGVDFEIKKENGYSAFKDAVKIRDRITHPKNKVYITLTTDEMIVFSKADIWFTELFSTLIVKIAERRLVA
jgi:hypothetical protein